MALSVDGRYALSASSDKTLKLWQLVDGRCLRTFSGHTWHVSSVALSSDGRYALSGSDDRTLKLWQLADGAMGQAAWQLADLCSYGRWAKQQEAISGWQAGSQDNLKRKRFSAALTLLQEARQDPQWAWSRANLAAWQTLLPIARSGGLRAAWLSRTLAGHTRNVSSLALSPDGRYALSGYWDKTVKLWELEAGTCLRTLEGHTSSVNSVALSSDGRYALSGSWDHTVKLWEA